MLLAMFRNLTRKRDGARAAVTHPALCARGQRSNRTLVAVRARAKLAPFDIAEAEESLRNHADWVKEFNARATFAGFDHLNIREADLLLDTHERRERRAYGDCRA